MSTPEAAGTSPTLTPRAPETFFAAQKRNRRATWRMTALCILAASLMGIPLTLVLTPLLYAVGMVIAEIVNHFSPLPAEFWQNANDLAKLAYHVADAAVNQRGTVDPLEFAIGLSLLLLPGIVFALTLWVGVRLLFRHGGVGGTIASLNAREPNQSDLKELQLADTVQEMAIAAGLPSPKVMLVDSSGANAAAVGTSAADAHIVLSRRTLDDLDRNQLQALIGHLVSSVGNGDLHIAFTVTSVFETCGLIIALINAPFGRQSRSTMWRIIRYPFNRGAGAADAEEVAELLADTMDVSSTDIDRFFNSGNAGVIRKFLRLVFFPIQFTNLAVEITLWFFLNLLLGPCMAALWRTRRYLADAGSVELTRNPDALASALQRLSEDTTTVEGGGWASHLFVVNPKSDRSLGTGAPSEQQRRALAAWQANGVKAQPATSTTTIPFPQTAGPQDFARIRKEMMSTVMAAATGDAAAQARMQAFVQAMGGPSALGLSGIPNPNDILVAQRGDRAAMARLRTLRQAKHPDVQQKQGRTGLQTYSFVSFHPPVNKREKRLQRMGAHMIAPARTGGSIVGKITLAVLYLTIGPLSAVAGALMLVLIAMMIGLNLLFLALWLSVIHWAFAQDWQQNVRAIMAFFDQLNAAFSRRR